MTRPLTVLVTGGAGFIGSHISSALLDAGHDVRVVDALLPQAWRNATPELDDRASFVVGDVGDARLIRDLLQGVDVVCHQAAMVGMGLDVTDQPAFVMAQTGIAVTYAELEQRTNRLAHFFRSRGLKRSITTPSSMRTTTTTSKAAALASVRASTSRASIRF